MVQVRTACDIFTLQRLVLMIVVAGHTLPLFLSSHATSSTQLLREEQVLNSASLEWGMWLMHFLMSESPEIAATGALHHKYACRTIQTAGCNPQDRTGHVSDVCVRNVWQENL